MHTSPGITKSVLIAVTGPESTGKTQLCETLAASFGFVYVPEFARNYLEQYGPEYTFEDVRKMASGHATAIRKALAESPAVVLVDTEFINYRIWFEEVFQQVPPEIETYIQEFSWDGILLCRPDIPWTTDALRENPDRGEYFFQRFTNMLHAYHFPYHVVEGLEKMRKKSAIQAIQQIRSE